MQNLKNVTKTTVKLNYTISNNGIQIQFIMHKNKYNDLTYALNINKKRIFSCTAKDYIIETLETFGLTESEIKTLVTIIKYNAYSEDNLICYLDKSKYKAELERMKDILKDILAFSKPSDKSFPRNKDINFLEQTLKPKLSIKEYEDLNNHIETEGLNKLYTVEPVNECDEAINITKFILGLLIKYKKYTYTNSNPISLEIEIMNDNNSDLSLSFKESENKEIEVYVIEYIRTNGCSYINANNIAFDKLDIPGQTFFENTFKNIDSSKYLTSINPNSVKDYLSKPDALINHYNMVLKKKTIDKVNELTNTLLLEYIYHGKLPKISNKTHKLLSLEKYAGGNRPNKNYNISSYKVFNADKYLKELQTDSKEVKIDYKDFCKIIQTIILIIQ
jgi:hypothetical protein